MSLGSVDPASPALVALARPQDGRTFPYAMGQVHGVSGGGAAGGRGRGGGGGVGAGGGGGGGGGGAQLGAQNSTFGLLVHRMSVILPRGGRALSISVGREPKMTDIEHVGFIRVEKSRRNFCTGSQYTGQWDGIGMSGFGTFVFPHKVEYEGQMKDGMFHGEGTLHYPMGQKMDGEWRDGHLVSMKYHFPDGLSYEEPWRYCQYPDRRFYMSVNEGLRPAGRELRTNSDPPRTIPPGCYDVGDGFYDPQTKCVVSPINLKKIIRIPTAAEEHWIVTNCRKAWDEPTGYRPELYPHWFTGRRRDIDAIYKKRTSEEAIDEVSKSIFNKND